MSRVTHRVVKGTRDILPPETAIWSAVEELARRVFSSYGYGEIRTPILEHVELFERSVGEATDIVGKEMYVFEDRKGRRLALRPESTASVARAYLETGIRDWPHPVRLFYLGPQFRRERPQKGRYRQFHQIGAELLGDASASADAELLLMLVRFLGELGFTDLEVLLNTLGDEEDRTAYREALVEWLRPKADGLTEDSLRRLETNPLRILDTKVPAERQLLEGVPALESFLGVDARAHFDELTGLLERFGVAYRIEPRLVRGLDYYTRTVFEIVNRDLGAQSALLGGGRYDGLVAELGGPRVPGIGFAIGEDRLVSVLPDSFREAHLPTPPAVAFAVGEVGVGDLLALCEALRADGLPVVAESGRKLGQGLKRASKLGCHLALILGDDELARGEVTVKDLETGEQRRVSRRELATELETRR